MGILDFIFGKDEKKKIFISFAVEDIKYRDFLVAQAKNKKSPFEFVDMSVKRPWNQNEWQERCKSKIRRCNGVIALLSRNTFRAGGARWEMKCAQQLRIPIVGMHIKQNDHGTIPPELRGKKIITWSWENLEKFIELI